MKRKFLLLVVLLFAGVFLAACANVTKQADFEVLSIDDIKDIEGGTTIKFKIRSGIINTALDDLIAEFEEEYPYITVERDAISGGYDDIRSTTILDINSKNYDNIPDLLIGYPDHFAEYYGGSNLIDLQFFIDDPEVGYTAEEMDDFIPGYLPENKGFDENFPERLYGLPFNKSTEVLVYNKTAFEALFGPTYLNKIPTTWDELRTVGLEIRTKVLAGELDEVWAEEVDPETGDIVKYLKVSDYLKDPNNIRFLPFGYDSSANGFITLTRQFNGKYTSRDSVMKGYVMFDNPESIAAMTYFQNMKNEGVFGNAAVFGEQYNSEAMKLIQVLISVGSSAGVGYNGSTEYDYELGVVPIPYHSEDAKYVIQQGTNLGMLSHHSDERKLATWLFIKFLLEPVNTAKFAMATGGYLPVRRSAYDTEEYKAYLESPSLDKVDHSAAANVALNDYIEKGFIFFVDDAFIGSSKVREEAGRIFDAIIVNGEDVKKRYEDAYKSLSQFDPKNK